MTNYSHSQDKNKNPAAPSVLSRTDAALLQMHGHTIVDSGTGAVVVIPALSFLRGDAVSDR